MAHALMTMLRGLATFGVEILNNSDCRALKGALGSLRFERGTVRKQALNREQANAIRRTAHDFGLHSLALARAFQFECRMQQKDAIGELVPITEPGDSDIIYGSDKWLHGIRWSDIDADLVLRHRCARNGRPVVHDLRKCPMVQEELKRLSQDINRGPVIVYEGSGVPYRAHQLRRLWRQVADAAGVPKTVCNMDSRPTLADRKSTVAFNEVIFLYATALEKIAKQDPRGTADMMSRLAVETLADARAMGFVSSQRG
jgi:hypothetical protein